MNGWAQEDVTVAASGTVYGASLTNQPISKEYRISAGGALNCAIKLTVASGVFATSIVAKLQTAIGADWVDAKTVTIAADGTAYIKLQAAVAGDQAHLPLLNKGRIVLTTGAGDSIAVTRVEVLQEL